ncbi:MAG: protein-glutamate O-methyltransferase CheR, partial [Proteobacteria bacterium]|nr:protein-glutamate O-methyltransferase CheR [Pseudomonadota bacterium]
MPNITEKEFENLARLIVETAGIQLDKGKEYLMEARMEPILERHGLDTYNDLYNQAISDATGKLKASIVDAITINETYFFRDNAPFDLLKNKVIPDIIDRKTTISPNRKIQLKIWSAACSTGQEVYSLGMMFREMRLNADRFEINILGTDISSEAVAKASYGKYNQFEIERGLSGHYLGKYFTKLANGWKIKDEIRSMARFSQMDLNKPFSGVGLFDVILCRNVAIYFPLSVKISLFQK